MEARKVPVGAKACAKDEGVCALEDDIGMSN